MNLHSLRLYELKHRVDSLNNSKARLLKDDNCGTLPADFTMAKKCCTELQSVKGPQRLDYTFEPLQGA